MQMSQLKPASSFAANFGCKSIAYGGPGMGKTPLIMTAPRPVLCVVEPGMLSMRAATNVPAIECYTVAAIKDFFKWVRESAEVKNFDTICVDSITQMAEIILKEKLSKCAHGKAAYGEMSVDVMEIIDPLYFMRNKHMYLICKQGTIEEAGTSKYRPIMPGQDLNVKIPHLFDVIMHLRKVLIPGQPDYVTAICTKDTPIAMARDRSGKLAEFEFPNLTTVFAKATS